MNTAIVRGFEILIHHIITPATKKTSIFPGKGDVSMEKQRILAHNRSGVETRGRKNERDQRVSSWERGCVCESKIDEVDF